MQESSYQEVLRKIVGRWILQPTGQTAAAEKLQIALEFRLPEGLNALRNIILDRDAQFFPPLTVAWGIEGVARLGGRP